MESTSLDQVNDVPLLEQRTIIKDLMAAHKDLRNGDTWYILSFDWFKKWKAYVAYYSAEPPGGDVDPPGPILNDPLISPDSTGGFHKLKDLSMEDYDFVIVPSPVFLKLKEWYGCEKEMPRQVTETFSKYKTIDLRPCFMRVELYTPESPQERKSTGPISFSSRLDTSAARQKACQALGVAFKPPQDSFKMHAPKAEESEEEKTARPSRLWNVASDGSLIRPLDDSFSFDLELDTNCAWFLLEVAKEDGKYELTDATSSIGYGYSDWKENQSTPTTTEAPNTPPPVKSTVYEPKTDDNDSDDEWTPFQSNKTTSAYGASSSASGVGITASDAQTDTVASKKSRYSDLDGTDDDEWSKTTTTYTYPARTASTFTSQFNYSSGGGYYSSGTGYSTSSYYNSSSSYDRHSSYGVSKKPGVVGLKNLGNTCFMNSGLQCLSNTAILRKHFLSKKYVKEINKDNPLGQGGKMAEEFAGVIEELWKSGYGVVSPYSFKSAIAKVAPQFAGYQQHDAAEFLSYLLDSLHEDLNRILKKPATEKPESNGRPDSEVAAESWTIHKMRNDSFIVDHFQGLLKSTLVCPKEGCNKVSITFDPFMFLSVPLPYERSRVMEVIFVSHANRSLPTKIACKVNKRGFVSDLRRHVASTVGVDPQDLVFAEVYTNKFYKFYTDHDALEDIQERDTIAVYEIKGLAQFPEIHTRYGSGSYGSTKIVLKDRPEIHAPTCVVTISGMKSDSFYPYTVRQGNLGVPFLVPFEKIAEGCESATITAADLYKYCFKFLAPYMKSVDPEFDTASPEKYFTASQQQSQEGEKDSEEMESDEKEQSSAASVCRPPFHLRLHDDSTSSTTTTTTTSVYYSYSSNAASDKGKELPYSEEEKVFEFSAEQLAVLRTPPKDGSLKEKDTYSYSYSNYYSWQSSSASSSSKAAEDSRRISIELDESIDIDKLMQEIEVHPSWEALKGKSGEGGGSAVTLEDCLHLYTAEERLEETDKWYCPKCAEFVQASKKIDVFNLPKVMVVQLKRFSYSGTWRDKIEGFVDYPVHGLDMSAFIGSKDSTVRPIYDLYAVSIHSGSLSFGHYTAYAKGADGEWYEFNDESVTRVDEHKVKTDDAYLLFYVRRDEDSESESEEETKEMPQQTAAADQHSQPDGESQEGPTSYSYANYSSSAVSSSQDDYYSSYVLKDSSQFSDMQVKDRWDDSQLDSQKEEYDPLHQTSPIVSSPDEDHGEYDENSVL